MLGVGKVGGAVLLVLLVSSGFLYFSDRQRPFNLFSAAEISSPGDWVKEEQIRVYPERVILDVPQASWAKFTDTNSMDPFLDAEANALEIMPTDPDTIDVGDIISYQTSYGVLIHRVIEKGIDEEGIYYVVKGDNNSFADPFKVRFTDVKGVLVAVIY